MNDSVLHDRMIAETLSRLCCDMQFIIKTTLQAGLSLSMPTDGRPESPNAAFRFAAAGFRSALKSAPAGNNPLLPQMAVLKAGAKFKMLPREKNRYFDGVFRGQGIAHNKKMHLENHHKVKIFALFTWVLRHPFG